jgi:hypothetical protein
LIGEAFERFYTREREITGEIRRLERELADLDEWIRPIEAARDALRRVR